MATCLGFNMVALEGEKLSISINDRERFDCEIYRTYGVFLTELPAEVPEFKKKKPAFEEEGFMRLGILEIPQLIE